MCFSALVKREAKLLEHAVGAVLIRDQLDDYRQLTDREPKKFPPLADRIFPGHYAPVVHERAGRRVAELMRYNIDPPGFIKNPGRLTCYNARRDNLDSAFWSESYLKHHGVLLLEGFYEWVKVNDLLKAGRVTLDDVRDQFTRQAEARRAKLEAQGKPYKPTPTEKTEPRLRRIIIEFRPETAPDLFVPVVFSERTANGRTTRGFAIVTDDPPPEVVAAGHDRCPIVLTRAAVDLWLRPEGKTSAAMQAVLDMRQTPHFVHKVDEAV